MKKGVLILAHGSREKQTEQTLESIMTLVREALPETEVQSAFLQFSERNLAWGLDSLTAQGVTNIKVVPYFLFSGVHIQEDIPAQLQTYAQNHPGIILKMGQTLGDDPRLAQILIDRIVH